MTSLPPRANGELLLEAFRRYLRDHSLPVTHQREVVAAAVFFADRHISVGELERTLAAQGDHVGTATVYRTLELLTRAGLIQEHDFGEGFKRYEPLAARGYHEHLICLRCGRVVEFASERFERMSQLIAEEHGFRHHHHRWEIYGQCRDCQRRDAATLQATTFDREGSRR
ncbi:MAG: transcriptional repressor [Gemmatimonadota bacterium]|nr:transcriptional repressor [Gemmatimonadota bacterium]